MAREVIAAAILLTILACPDEPTNPAVDTGPRPCFSHAELCNGVDDDCNGLIDEEPASSSCAVPNATGAACVNGACVATSCRDGFADCDGEGGCETDLSNSRDHCGICERSCAPNEGCFDRVCKFGAIDIAIGFTHSCALLTSSEVKCWGMRFSDEPTALLQDPTLIGTFEAATKLRGSSEQCVLDRSGTVRCLSFDDDESLEAYDVPGLPPVVDLELDSHACAVTAIGDLWCWGNGFSGQLGSSAVTFTATAVQVLGVPDVVDVALGIVHTCALDDTGHVHCFGANYVSQLGVSTNISNSSSAPLRLSGLEDILAISAGYYHTCALRNDGTIFCWGYNNRGQTGGPASTSTIVEVRRIPEPVELFAGTYSTCVSTRSGEVFCLGANIPGFESDQTSAVHVPELDGATKIEISSVHGCAVFRDGSVKCWGANDYGAVGAAPLPVSADPQPVPGIVGATELVAGEHHACAIAGGRLWCWGAAEERLFAEPALVPIEIPTATVVRASAGRSHTCAVTTSSTVECFGRNTSGELGSGSSLFTRDVIEVAGLPLIREVATLETASCALSVAGDVWCWGASFRGALGERSFSLSPFHHASLGSIRSIHAGSEELCAVRSDGQLVCLGLLFAEGDYVLFPSGETSTAAVEVDGIIDPISVSAGLSNCAVASNGSTMCWGRNRCGQLGDGSTEPRRDPAPILAIQGARQVDAGRHTCVVRETGPIACFGANWASQLGDRTTENRATPIEVAGIEDAVRVVTGTGFSCALRSDGTVVCWGWESRGRLGRGARPITSTPVEIPF